MRLFLSSLTLTVFSLAAADWPTYRGDATRGGYTADVIPNEQLRERWAFRVSPPRPAWPTSERMEYDLALQPIIVGDLVNGFTNTFHGFYKPLRIVQPFVEAFLDASLEPGSLLDVLGMTGAEVAREAKLRRPGLPMIFITGYADLAAVQNLGEDAIVQKPFRDDELLRWVRRLLGSPRPGNVVPMRK